jgi:hypothetical protein
MTRGLQQLKLRQGAAFWNGQSIGDGFKLLPFSQKC